MVIGAPTCLFRPLWLGGDFATGEIRIFSFYALQGRMDGPWQHRNSLHTRDTAVRGDGVPPSLSD